MRDFNIEGFLELGDKIKVDHKDNYYSTGNLIAIDTNRLVIKDVDDFFIILPIYNIITISKVKK